MKTYKVYARISNLAVTEVEAENEAEAREIAETRSSDDFVLVGGSEYLELNDVNEMVEINSIYEN